VDRDRYQELLRPLHVELLRMQRWIQDSGARVLLVVEGRDAAGKGGAIKRLTKHLNPRHCRVVALSQPSDVERTQWYFQRYVAHLPAGGELVLFDRSWYNRAGLERVMGYCAPAQAEELLRSAPELEHMLVRAGVRVLKVFFEISRDEQQRRLAARRANPLKRWKLTPLDEAAGEHWDAYTQVEDEMFRRTSTPWAPWTVVQADDKRLARLELIRWLLSQLPYAGDPGVDLQPDPAVLRQVTTQRVTNPEDEASSERREQ
jgi:polyphosphate kinase